MSCGTVLTFSWPEMSSYGWEKLRMGNLIWDIHLCSELYETSRATVNIREACIIEYTMQFWSCLCIDFIFIWEHNYKLWSNCVIYPVTSIYYPVWMPWKKYQCNKYHWFICWGWGERFLYWGFGQWQFVIGIWSQDQ